MNKVKKYRLDLRFGKLVILLAVLLFSGQLVLAGSTGNTTGDAWAEKFGYVALDGGGGSVDYGVTVASAALSGYAWSEKTGWIDFNDAGSYYAVINDGAGNLNGYAWSEKLGYICFDDPGGYYQAAITDCGTASSTPGAVIFKGAAIFKTKEARFKPGQLPAQCLAGYAWSEKGGYINFDDAGSLYSSETEWAL